MWSKTVAAILPIVFLWLILAGPGFADRIVLKDGTVEESEKVWTSDRFVHFILKGTRSVEIRYAIDIVERVEKKDTASPTAIEDVETTTGGERKKNDRHLKSLPDPTAHDGATTPATMNKAPAALRKIERESGGIRFYDPRRSKRYQVSKTGGHNDLQSALKELAALYDRAPEWVAEHMGEENDLQAIHRNLAKQRQLETMSKAPPLTAHRPAPQNKMVEPSSGDEAQVAGIPTHGKALREKAAYPALKIDKRIKFYDPRRPKKYWTGSMDRHNSLEAALASLARQYDVTPQWIEDHMGESNLLFDIHESIRSSLLGK